MLDPLSLSDPHFPPLPTTSRHTSPPPRLRHHPPGPIGIITTKLGDAGSTTSTAIVVEPVDCGLIALLLHQPLPPPAPPNPYLLRSHSPTPPSAFPLPNLRLHHHPRCPIHIITFILGNTGSSIGTTVIVAPIECGLSTSLSGRFLILGA